MNNRQILARRFVVLMVGFAAGFANGPNSYGQVLKPLAVEPSELTKHREWLGKTLVVDDRVSLFQWRPRTFYDQVFLKSCPEVVFELPDSLRMERAPSAHAVRLTGVLHESGGRWWFDVEEMELLPTDLERLEKAIKTASAADIEGRLAWVNWARKRASAFDDKALLAKALEVEAGVIRAEAERPRGDKTAYWITLAERAKGRHVPEPEPSAVFHQGLRSGIENAKDLKEVDDLVAKLEGFLPNAKTSKAEPADVDLDDLETRYRKDPGGVYRKASAPERAALDRRAWEELTERSLRLRETTAPATFGELADEAAAKLPNRPQLATSIIEAGLKRSTADITELRQSEIERLAALYRERLKQPEKGRQLYRAWLDDQRKNRLSARDAEGRIALAKQYLALIDDKTTAIALMQEAWKLDPTSTELEQSFLNLGYRNVGNDWVKADKPSPPSFVTGEAPPETTAALESEMEAALEPRRAIGEPQTTTTAKPAAARKNTAGFRNATPEEVRGRMSGNPDRRIRSRSQGDFIEQWIYLGTRDNQYVNFRRKSGEPQLRAVSAYVLPKSNAKGHSTP